MSIDNALKTFTVNKGMKLQLVEDEDLIAADDITAGRHRLVKIEKLEKVSIQDFDINAKARQLSDDY